MLLIWKHCTGLPALTKGRSEQGCQQSCADFEPWLLQGGPEAPWEGGTADSGWSLSSSQGAQEGKAAGSKMEAPGPVCKMRNAGILTDFGSERTPVYPQCFHTFICPIVPAEDTGSSSTFVFQSFHFHLPRAFNFGVSIWRVKKKKKKDINNSKKAKSEDS